MSHRRPKYPHTALAQKILKQATRDALPLDHPLRTLAWTFDQATRDYYAHGKKLTGKQFKAVQHQTLDAWDAYTRQRDSKTRQVDSETS